MAIQSDFAQKLLQDLRVRKERMAAAQSTSLQSAETCRSKNEMTARNSFSPERRQHPLTEPEKKLKETAIKSQTFLSTAEALFKLNLPASFLHAAEQEYEPAEDKVVLNCAQEVMKRKARRHEAANQPHTKTALACPTVRSFDDLIEQLGKDMETLKFYGGNLGEEHDLAARLYRMVEKDISDNKVADVNCMWDLEWSNITALVSENGDVLVREVERYMLNALLDEINGDLVE